MSKRDIKRYSLAQLKARLARRGGVLRTRPDAPAYELDDTFWQEGVRQIPSGGGASGKRSRIYRPPSSNGPSLVTARPGPIPRKGDER